MMIDITLLNWGFWVFVLSLTAAYYAWSFVRVYILRNDLYAIRDELWSRAKSQNAFDDRAYIETRRQLHSLIENSHRVNLPLLIYVKLKTRGLSVPTFSPITDRPEVKAACTDALDAATACVTRYVVRYRFFSGFMLITAMRVLFHVVSWVSLIFDVCTKAAYLIRNGSNVGNLAWSFVRFAGLGLMDSVKVKPALSR